MGMLTLGACFYHIDVRGRRAWAWPFKVYGMNAIAAYVISGAIVRICRLIKIKPPGADKAVDLWAFCSGHVTNAVKDAGTWWNTHLHAISPIGNPASNVALAMPIALILVVFLILCVMYACKFFVKV
jgi:predicted acyltransferase